MSEYEYMSIVTPLFFTGVGIFSTIFFNRVTDGFRRFSLRMRDDFEDIVEENTDRVVESFENVKESIDSLRYTVETSTDEVRNAVEESSRNLILANALTNISNVVLDYFIPTTTRTTEHSNDFMSLLNNIIPQQNIRDLFSKSIPLTNCKHASRDNNNRRPINISPTTATQTCDDQTVPVVNTNEFNA